MVVLEQLIRNQSSSNNEEGDADEELEETKVDCKSDLTSMDNLIECLKSSANIVSSTSTVVGRRAGVVETLATSTMVGSDFGDVFPYTASSSTLDWIQNHNLDAATDPSSLNAHSDKHMPTVDEEEVDSLDSDEDDVEHELIGTILELGIEKLEEGDLQHAEDYLTDCYKRISALFNYASQANSLRSLRKTTLENLIKLYQAKEDWKKASEYLKEKLLCSVKGDKVENAKDTLALAQTLQKNSEHSEALGYARKAYKAFKSMGPAQHSGCEQALRTLAEICLSEKNTNDANAFLAILNKLVRSRTVEQGPSVQLKKAEPIPPSLLPARTEIIPDPANVQFANTESVQSDDFEEPEVHVKNDSGNLGPFSETTSISSRFNEPILQVVKIDPSPSGSDEFVDKGVPVNTSVQVRTIKEKEASESLTGNKVLGRGNSIFGRVSKPFGNIA
jgi:tetratricopeptide (TPR) repeat protein